MESNPFTTPPAHVRAAKEDNEARARFKIALSKLRERNKELSGHQLRDRLTKEEEKKKPVAERSAVNMQGKDSDRALDITVLLVLMRKIKGLPLTTVQKKVCRHCGTALSEKEVPIHAYPTEDIRKDVARRIETEFVHSYKLSEFLK